MTGRSVALDPTRFAVRADLADIRLADRVFAPHYVAALSCRLVGPATLRAGLGEESERLAELDADEPFEVLELTHDRAWGVAPCHGRVGYIPAGALATA